MRRVRFTVTFIDVGEKKIFYLHSFRKKRKNNFFFLCGAGQGTGTEIIHTQRCTGVNIFFLWKSDARI